METLTKGYPIEFREYMEYCRQRKFEEDPDYKHCVSLFEKCMKRHNLDPKQLDYTWKQNRLSKDKESLKASMMDVIRKKPKDPTKETDIKKQTSIMPMQGGGGALNRESGIAGEIGRLAPDHAYG